MRRIVAVGAVIVKEDSVILGKHVPERKGFWADRWICPGGRLNFGESLVDGVKREILEETNLDIEIGDFIISFDRICVDNGIQTHIIYIDYFGIIKRGDLKASSDLGIVKFIKICDLNDISDEIHEDTKVLLKKAGLLG